MATYRDEVLEFGGQDGAPLVSITMRSRLRDDETMSSRRADLTGLVFWAASKVCVSRVRVCWVSSPGGVGVEVPRSHTLCVCACVIGHPCLHSHAANQMGSTCTCAEWRRLAAW